MIVEPRKGSGGHSAFSPSGFYDLSLAKARAAFGSSGFYDVN